MITAFASLALTPSWREDQLAVVCATDALRLCREGGFEALPRHQAGSFLGNLGRREDGSVRAFISRARLSGAPLSGFEDGELLALLHDRVRSGELVVLRACELTADADGNTSAEQRKLVREIEAQTRGRLADAGRQYRLVVGDDLGKLSDRNSYEVVRQEDAVRVLDGVARQYGEGAPGLPALLAQARTKLTRDWRPPLSPDGLVLLRRIVVVSSQRPDVGPAMTPSAMKKLRDEGWIEIEFVDAGMEPVENIDFEVRLADGQTKSGRTSKKGPARYENITPGECMVRFPNVKSPVVLV